MNELKKNGKILTSKSVGTGPSTYAKRIYRAVVSQRLRNTGLDYENTIFWTGENVLHSGGEETCRCLLVGPIRKN
jgi:hypothetical protein